MRKLLIADGCEESARLLADRFRTEYDVTLCRDGQTLAKLLHTLRPDLLILDLSLPVWDGFRVLRRSADVLPPVIIAITSHPGDDVAQQAMELGVGRVMVRPFAFRAVREQLTELIWRAEHPGKSVVSPQTVALRHMLILGLAPGSEGFHQLRLGIPLYAQDPAMSMGKELYSAICTRLGGGDGRAIEHNIRSVIKAAWERRETELWQSYFPHHTQKAPSNREFIARLAVLVELEQQETIQVRPFPPEI